MHPISYYLLHPNATANRLLERYFTWLPDELFLKITFRLSMGYNLNLKNPKTFCEKLQWLKLYNRRPEYTIMVDKVKAKQYVASVLGEEYVIPTLGVWKDPDEIDFDALPDCFVLKCNHNSGLGMYICKDKSNIDVDKVRKELYNGLKQNYYSSGREWPYRDVPHRILAESYISPSSVNKDLSDYKWFCFNGEPMYCQVIQDRSTKETIDFFDTSWIHQDFVGLNPIARNAKMMPERPAHLDTHLHIARELSKGIPFVRIDLYETVDRPYFGEMTFFPNSGMGILRPKKYNELFGKMLILPPKSS